MKKRIHELLLGTCILETITKLIPTVSLFDVPIPIGILIYLGYWVVILLVEGYRRLKRKIVADIKREIIEELSA